MKLARVNKVWHEASKRSYVWEIRYQVEYGRPNVLLASGASWRELFEAEKKAERNMKHGFGVVTNIASFIDMQNGRYRDAERLYLQCSGSQDAMIINTCHSPCYWNSYCDDQVLSTELVFPRTGRKVRLSEGNCPFMIQGDYVLWTNWINRYYFSGPLWIEPKFVPLATAIKLSENAPSWWVDAPSESFQWTLGSPYDPDSYNNDYEIKCIANQNCNSNVVCIAEEPMGGASFTVRAFDLENGGFYWPMYVYCYHSEEVDSRSFIVEALNMKDGSRSTLLKNGGGFACPMVAFSNDGAECAVAYLSDKGCSIGIFDMTVSGFPEVENLTIDADDKINKMALCRSKVALTLRNHDHYLDYVDIYGRPHGKRICRMLARAQGWHLGAPFRFLQSSQLLLAADDVILADFKGSVTPFKIGLVQPDQPSFSVRLASVVADRLLASVAKHFGLDGSSNVSNVRSLLVYEDDTMRLVVLYNSADQSSAEVNTTATTFSRWFAGARDPSKVELTPYSCPFNGYLIGSQVKNMRKMEYSEMTSERGRHSRYPETVKGDAFLVCQTYIAEVGWSFCDLPERIGSKAEFRWASDYDWKSPNLIIGK